MGLDPRQCLHSAATFEGSDEVEEAGIVSSELVVSRCDAAEVFDLVEEALDEVPLLVEDGIEAAPLCSCRSTRDDWAGPACRNGHHGTLPVIAFVRQDVPSLQAIEQGFDLGDVVAFATGKDEAHRITQSIGCGMNLGAQTALGASQRVSFKPIFGSIAFFGAPALCW